MNNFSITFLAVSGVSTLLIYLGYCYGYQLGAQQPTSVTAGMNRRKVLGLLRKLGAWTTEYSGSVSRYQDELGQLSKAVQTNNQVPKMTTRVPELLEQMMVTNEQLTERLNEAERQLEKQTQQLESYLCQARTDALTGLANRRALDQKLEELLAAYHQNSGPSFVMVLLDIDHFKRINDEYGHPAGDEVLQQVSSILSQDLADCYLVARFGGEEFAALLPAPLTSAAKRMNSIRQSISRQRVDSGDFRINITISIGLSEVQKNSLTGSVVRYADEALYAAKEMGRDRVYYHDGNETVLYGSPTTAIP